MQIGSSGMSPVESAGRTSISVHPTIGDYLMPQVIAEVLRTNPGWTSTGKWGTARFAGKAASGRTGFCAD